MKKLVFIIALAIGQYVIAAESMPYKGQQDRNIKALSSSEIEGLKKGRGMGLAKAAELNHYPGPLHVLQEASRLSLSNEQLDKTKALYNSMKNEAITVGNKIIAAERTLDALFANKKISDNKLRLKLNEIGALRSELRFIHLKTHLEQKKLLSDAQIKHYDKLRGYGGKHDHHNHHGHH